MRIQRSLRNENQIAVVTAMLLIGHVEFYVVRDFANILEDFFAEGARHWVGCVFRGVVDEAVAIVEVLVAVVAFEGG
jgi:hypothetical protein